MSSLRQRRPPIVVVDPVYRRKDADPDPGRERAFGGVRSRGGRVDVPRPASDDERPERGRERGALVLERRDRPGEPPFAFLRQVEWPDAGVAGGHGTADQAEVLRASRELRRRALADRQPLRELPDRRLALGRRLDQQQELVPLRRQMVGARDLLRAGEQAPQADPQRRRRLVAAGGRPSTPASREGSVRSLYGFH